MISIIILFQLFIYLILSFKRFILATESINLLEISTEIDIYKLVTDIYCYIYLY